MRPIRLRQLGWVAAASGVATLVFGLLTLLWPGLSLFLLALFFGLYALVDGLVALFGLARAARGQRTWWPYLVIGGAGLAAGLLALTNPGVGGQTLLYVIAAWALVVGLVHAITALTEGPLTSLAGGAVTIAFGMLLLANVGRGALALVLFIGAFAVITGLLRVLQALRVPRVD